MEVFYSNPIDNCHFTIKCIPESNLRQRITDMKIQMVPESRYGWGTDSHGNKYIFGCNPAPHSYFKYRISGDAECMDEAVSLEASENDIILYRHSHGMTLPGTLIKKYHSEITKSIPDFKNLKPFDQAVILMDRLHKDFKYEKNCTCIKTSAEEAMELGRGVCQDYSHIIISLLNLSGCSARYVTGFIIGEGESHAWVEVVSDGKWMGIDPTNNICVGDEHIRVGAGREACECELNRGIMHGNSSQMQRITVSVMEKKSIVSLLKE